MAIKISAESLEEVPEVMREFVSESDGALVYDEERAFKALVEERNGRRGDRKELAKFKELGKTSEELAELLKSAGNGNQAGSDPTKSAEYLTLKKQFEELDGKYKPVLEAYEKERAEKLSRDTWDAVEKLIGQLDDKYDRERVREWAKDSKSYFKLNAISELDEVDGKKPLDFIISKADKLKLLKESTPSKFGSGRVNNPNTDQKNVTGGAREGGFRERVLASLREDSKIIE